MGGEAIPHAESLHGEERLDRVLKYLNASSSMGIVTLPAVTGIYLHAYADAMKLQTVANVGLGKGPVFTS